MNKKNRIFTLLLVCTTAFVMTSCSDDDNDPEPTTTTTTNTIVDVAEDNGFTILKSALERVNLDDVLKGDGPFTVFAPTDEAFTNLLTELNLTGLDQVSDADLTQILLNHVVSGKVESSMLEAGYVSTLADGPEETKLSLLVDLTDGVMLNNRSKVSMANVQADNGVVHVINKVITLPNVVDVALANPDFSILVAALTRADLTTNFVEVLSAAGPYTVFAPTNQAFTDLLNSNMDWDELDDIPVETLEAVLKYHVLAGTNVTASEIVDGSMPETFEGTEITLNTMPKVTVTDANDGVSDVIAADVQSSNGVIHAINKVLLP